MLESRGGNYKMKKNIMYFRNPRVGSSNFIALLTKMVREGHINDMQAVGHCSYEIAKSECIKSKGIKFWNNSIKVVQIRNPWDQHVSFFLKTRKLDRSTDQIAKTFKDLPERKQKAYIDDFQEVVKQQLKFIKGESNMVYDAKSVHANKKGKRINAVDNPLAQTYRLDFIYTCDGKNMADYTIRMEKQYLQNELENMLKDINVPLRLATFYTNEAKRVNYNNDSHFDYKEFYDEYTKNAVYEIRKIEIDLHKYNFN